jgi:hypothetical protein
MLAAQDVRDDGRQAADDQPVGIDEMPFLVDLGRLGRLGRLHQRLHGDRPLGLWKKRRVGAPPSGELIADGAAKVKQIRHFTERYNNTRLAGYNGTVTIGTGPPHPRLMMQNRIWRNECTSVLAESCS